MRLKERKEVVTEAIEKIDELLEIIEENNLERDLVIDFLSVRNLDNVKHELQSYLTMLEASV